MNSQWKDVTSYTQGDEARMPTSWERRVCQFRLVVTCAHIRNPGRWTMHVYPGLADTQDIADAMEMTALGAQLHAERFLVSLLKSALQQMNND